MYWIEHVMSRVSWPNKAIPAWKDASYIPWGRCRAPLTQQMLCAHIHAGKKYLQYTILIYNILTISATFLLLFLFLIGNIVLNSELYWFNCVREGGEVILSCYCLGQGLFLNPKDPTQISSSIFPQYWWLINWFLDYSSYMFHQNLWF